MAAAFKSPRKQSSLLSHYLKLEKAPRGAFSNLSQCPGLNWRPRPSLTLLFYRVDIKRLDCILYPFGTPLSVVRANTARHGLGHYLAINRYSGFISCITTRAGRGQATHHGRALPTELHWQCVGTQLFNCVDDTITDFCV